MKLNSQDRPISNQELQELSDQQKADIVELVESEAFAIVFALAFNKFKKDHPKVHEHKHVQEANLISNVAITDFKESLIQIGLALKNNSTEVLNDYPSLSED